MNKENRDELVELIVSAREFCASAQSENEAIRDFASEEGIFISKKEILDAKNEASKSYNHASVSNHIYHG